MAAEQRSRRDTPDDVRVLVVDDSRDAAEALARILEINGYVVETAEDGVQALTQVEAFRPHCVLLDVDMPRVDGLELSRTLRARYGDDIVLIAVTGWSTGDSRVAQTFEVVDHYLRKPLDPQELQRLLPPTT